MPEGQQGRRETGYRYQVNGRRWNRQHRAGLWQIPPAAAGRHQVQEGSVAGGQQEARSGPQVGGQAGGLIPCRKVSSGSGRTATGTRSNAGGEPPATARAGADTRSR